MTSALLTQNGRHAIKLAVLMRRVGQRRLAVETRSHFVVGEHVGDIERVGHRLYVLRIQLREQLDIADDLTKLPFAIGLSRAARRVIIQNIAFALVVKAIFLVATLLGVATLWMAVFADTGAALIVIANGMRLLRYR